MPADNHGGTLIASRGLALDLALLLAGALMVLTDLNVLFFHVVFVLLTVVAFSLPLRRFVLRVAVWASLASLDLVQGVWSGVVHPDELIEIPLMLAMIGLVSWIASRREQARQRLATFESIIRGASEAVVVLDASGRVRYASPATETVLGRSPAALERDGLAGVVPSDDLESISVMLRNGLDGPAVAEHALVIDGGEQRWAETTFTSLSDDQLIGGTVLTIRDVTERRRLRDQLADLAFHDQLTGLPNRALFTERLEAAVARAHAGVGAIGVLFVDIDGFKAINDRLGHRAGDRLLSVVAERIQGQLRRHDLAARFGGDEFVVLLDRLEKKQDAGAVADRMISAVAEPIELEGEFVRVGLSIGVACAVGAEVSVDLLRRADVAMYRAKARGGGSHELFSPALFGLDAASG